MLPRSQLISTESPAKWRFLLQKVLNVQFSVTEYTNKILKQTTDYVIYLLESVIPNHIKLKEKKTTLVATNLCII